MSVFARCAANVKKLKCKLGEKEKPRGFPGLCKIIFLDCFLFELSVCSSPTTVTPIGHHVHLCTSGRLEAESSRWRQSSSCWRWWIRMSAPVRTSPKPALWQFVPIASCLRSSSQCVTRGGQAWFCPNWVRMDTRPNSLRKDTSFYDVKTAYFICRVNVGEKWKRKEKGVRHKGQCFVSYTVCLLGKQGRLIFYYENLHR